MIRRQNGVGSLARITIGEAGELPARLLTFSSVSAKRVRCFFTSLGPGSFKWDFQMRRTGRISTRRSLGKPEPRGPLPRKGATSCFFLSLSPNKCPKGTPTSLGSPTTNHPPPTPAASECFPGNPAGWKNVMGWKTIRFESVSHFGHITVLVGSRISADLVTHHRMRKRFAVQSEPSFLRRLCFTNGHLSNRYVCVSLFATRSGALDFTQEPGRTLKQQPARVAKEPSHAKLEPRS
jgi:hypothetical protein